jgi:hypothetical protein
MGENQSGFTLQPSRTYKSGKHVSVFWCHNYKYFWWDSNNFETIGIFKMNKDEKVLKSLNQIADEAEKYAEDEARKMKELIREYVGQEIKKHCQTCCNFIDKRTLI